MPEGEGLVGLAVGFNHRPAIDTGEVCEGAVAVAIGDGFPIVTNLITARAEAGDGGEGLGVCGNVVVPDFAGFDGLARVSGSKSRAAT